MKWMGALIGYLLYRFPGALLGFFLGSLLERTTLEVQGFRTPGRSLSKSSFELKLLSLAALVIKADGAIKQEELRYVRNYFIGQYGADRAQEIFQLFNEEIKKQTQSVRDLGAAFTQATVYATRVQILHFLFGIANADGIVSPSELEKLNQIAAALRLRSQDFISIKAMFVADHDQAYKILDLTPEASDEQIKKAYRTKVKKYHPDRIKTQDEALKKGAQQKFIQIQEAYESLKKKRGF
ncbi:MAG: TerB family tellurite resistance protein [Flavobacteriaceae bacterium]